MTKRLAMHKIIAFISVVTVLCLSGCASIVSGQKQQLTFNSEPSGANVAINSVVVGQTPITLMVDRKQDHSVAFQKEGYKPETLALSTTLNGWFWGNIVFGGFLGSTTDAASGAMHEYAPDHYFVTLVPASATSSINPLSDRAKANDFIVMNYARVIDDLSKGDGQYLSSLFALLRVPKDGEADAKKKIQALATVYTIIPEFADQVVSYFLKPDSGAKT